MNDIVKQLRNLAEYSDDIINVNPSLLIEAADEIERLRKDIESLNQMLRDTGYGQGQIDAYAAQCEEIERLRKENKLLRLGWCKESEKRMKEWQNEPIATLNTITTGDTQCRYCNGVGQIQMTYPNNGNFLCWVMCNRCNGAGTS